MSTIALPVLCTGKLKSVKVQIFRTSKIFAVISINFKFRDLSKGKREMCPKVADGMTNSLDPDLTAPLGTV